MRNQHITIAGAGLTGLIAAHAFPRARINEALDEASLSKQEHTALLRFRTDSVSRLTGIPFRKVRVQKSIVVDGEHVAPNLSLSNRYAAKVLEATGGKVSGRSILNTADADRYVAPASFIEEMRENLRDRIAYGHPEEIANRIGINAPYASDILISTIPLPTLLKEAAKASWVEQIATQEQFHFAAIRVVRYRLSDVDLHQTIYYPGEETDIYRASITGDTLTIECVIPVVEQNEKGFSLMGVLGDFGLPWVKFDEIDDKVQRYGKIVDIDSTERRRLLRELTERGGIYSLGRFATWRNVLLDDVANDIEVIRRMMSLDRYGREASAPAPEIPF